MSHYEERLQRDIEAIRSRVRKLTESVSAALDTAVRAVLTYDKPLASRSILDDLPINREVRAIDRACHAFVAQHLPTAAHLRFVSAVLRLLVAVERVGDYAVTICRETVQLSARPPEMVERDLEAMSEQARRLYRQAARSFHEQSADLARGTKGLADRIPGTFDRIFADLTREGESGTRPIRDLFALLVVFNSLERVNDQAKNICEETIFAVEGATKAPKVYNLLFLDKKDNRLAPLAVAIARKAYPESCRYTSAGWSPAEALDPELLAFLEKNGFDTPKKRPERVPEVHDELAEYQVIVALASGSRKHLATLPFRTVFLEWPGIEKDGSLDDAYRSLSHEIRELIETLRGEEAS